MRPQLVNLAERSFAARLSRAVSVTCNALILAGFLTVIVPGWVSPLVKGQAATQSQGQLSIMNIVLPGGVEGVPYTGTLMAQNQAGPNVAWAVASATPDLLPLGLTLAPSTGAITGTPGPGSAGTGLGRIYDVRFSVDDGNAIVYKTVSLTINHPGFTYQKADVNRDGRINVGDIQALVTIILNSATASWYGQPGNITVQDVQGVVNCVLGVAPCP